MHTAALFVSVVLAVVLAVAQPHLVNAAATRAGEVVPFARGVGCSGRGQSRLSVKKQKNDIVGPVGRFQNADAKREDDWRNNVLQFISSLRSPQSSSWSQT